jgi:hypothetical protein
VAGILDHIFARCETGPLPGVVLGFQEYDRTNAELAGGAYTGTGDRENLGTCATDLNGNYIFRFSRSLAQFIEEATVDTAPGENAAVAALPDAIVRLLDPSKALGYCYESAPYWNIQNLYRINICVPKDCIGRLPTVARGQTPFRPSATSLSRARSRMAPGRLQQFPRSGWEDHGRSSLADAAGKVCGLVQGARFLRLLRRPSRSHAVHPPFQEQR